MSYKHIQEKRWGQILHVKDTVRRVESLITDKEPPKRKFIPLNVPGRFLSLKSLKKSMFTRWNPAGMNPHLEMYPHNNKTALKILRRSMFKKTEFHTSADIILVAANINLFYLDEGIRVKIFVPNGIRSLSEFQNEFVMRKKIEIGVLLLVPEIIGGNISREPYYFMDKVVFGDLLTWDHPNAPSTFREIIPDIWNFYRSNGITWSTLKENRINLHETIEEYISLRKKGPEYRFDFDLRKMKLFDGKLLPRSLIHGDLSVNNIIRTSEGNYILDWELSRNDFVINDLQRLLLIREWDLHKDIDSLMCAEIERCFHGEKNSVLSLDEQLLLSFFLDVYGAYKDTSDPSRLDRFEQQFSSCFD